MRRYQHTFDGSGNPAYDARGQMVKGGMMTSTWDRARRLLSMGGGSHVHDGEGGLE